MPFETTVSSAAPAGYATPLLAIAVPQGSALPPSLSPLDDSAGGALGRLYAAGDFAGKRDEVAVIYPPGPAGRMVLVGLGKVEGGSPPDLRRAAAIASKRARTLGAPAGAFFLAPEGRGGLEWREVGQRVAEGLAQGAWVFSELKKPAEDRKPPLEAFTLLAPDETTAVTEGHRVGAAIGAGQTFTRSLQVLPGNVCTPTHLGRTAEELARRYGFGVTVLDRAAIEREKMGALLCVAQGSAEEPRFIALEYTGAAGPPVVLVGKGVTFDTGGISIKPAQNMEIGRAHV